ncbi:MAG: VanZ family protein [Clostridia bacterium]|nr:VanZ family protein [Clostridia bacterium]
MKIKTAAVVAAVIGWLSFIFTNSLKSGEKSAEQSAGLEHAVNELLQRVEYEGDAARLSELIVRKTAHAFEFFVLCLLLFWAFYLLIKNKRAVNILTVVLTVTAAAVDESLQLISKRGASVKDVFIDCIGILLAYLTLKLIFKIKSKKES